MSSNYSTTSTLALPTTAPTTPQSSPKPKPPMAQVSGGSEASNYEPSEDSEVEHKANHIPRRAPLPIPWKHHGKTSADHIAVALALQPSDKLEKVYTDSVGSSTTNSKKPKIVKATTNNVSCSWQVL